MKHFKKRIEIANPRGVALVDCFNSRSVYELVDRSLEIILKRMLNLPPESGPLIVSVPLLLLAYVVSRQTINQVTILGISVFTDKLSILMVKGTLGAIGGSILLFYAPGLVTLTTAIMTLGLVINIARGINSFECDNFIQKVSMERISNGPDRAFLEGLPEKTPKIFIKGNENIEIFVPSYDSKDSCYSEYRRFQVKKKSNLLLLKPETGTETETHIHRKCEKKYIPLKVRTKTLSDLKIEDSTENREKAAPYIEKYEERRRRIMNKRIE
jgi:hypothetical protein